MFPIFLRNGERLNLITRGLLQVTNFVSLTASFFCTHSHPILTFLTPPFRNVLKRVSNATSRFLKYYPRPPCTYPINHFFHTVRISTNGFPLPKRNVIIEYPPPPNRSPYMGDTTFPLILRTNNSRMRMRLVYVYLVPIFQCLGSKQLFLNTVTRLKKNAYII